MLDPEDTKVVDAAIKALDAGDTAGARKGLLRLVVLAEQANGGDAPGNPAAPVDDGSDPAPVTEARLRRARVAPKVLQDFRANAVKDPRKADTDARSALRKGARA